MIRITDISKSYGTRVLLDHLSYHFPEGKKIALVGANGAGKSTLLNILCNYEAMDSGEIIKPTDCRLGYLAQKPTETPEATVLAETLSGATRLMELQAQMEKALLGMESDYETFGNLYAEAEASFRNLGGYQLEAKAHGILTGLGFAEEAIQASPLKLSGGWRMRVELAKLFVSDPDFLILDEPTNHLDLPSLVWVESFLANYKGTLLFVSHDLALLNRLPKMILHLNAGILREYHGNYDKFLTQKTIVQGQASAQLDNLRKKREKMQDFVDRFGAKASKATQAQSRVKMIDKIKDLENEVVVEEDASTIAIRFPPPPNCSRVVVSIDGGVTGYKSILSSNISLVAEKGFKVAIIGANGIGKSTLLKTLSGVTPALGGVWNLGANVVLSYFSQDQRDSLNREQSVMENLLSATNIAEREGRGLLGSLLFRGDDVKKQAKVLSGGELNRLALSICLAKKANLLVLDEPTNHLDMASVEMLASSLAEWSGTVLFVSHDRNFIDKVCTHIFVVLADGRTCLFEGKLEDYRRMAKLSQFPDVLDPESLKQANAEFDNLKKNNSEQKAKSNSEKSSKNENKKSSERSSDASRLAKIETIIEDYKAQLSEKEAKMAELPAERYQEAIELNQECEALRKLIEEEENNWLALS